MHDLRNVSLSPSLGLVCSLRFPGLEGVYLGLLADGCGEGIVGEGSVGATMKDTRTKSRGRVEVGEGGGTGWGGVEGWGENCN